MPAVTYKGDLAREFKRHLFHAYFVRTHCESLTYSLQGALNLVRKIEQTFTFYKAFRSRCSVAGELLQA